MEKNENEPAAPLSKKIQVITTVVILAQNVAFGSSFSFYAPALKDLEDQHESSVDEISKVFTIMMVAYCCGGLTSGFAYKWVNRQLAVALYFTGMAVGLFVTPHCPNITSFFVAGFVIGYCAGAYDCVQIVWVMELWQSKAGPFIQAQHFSYALGSNIPALLLAPFLVAKDDDDENDKMLTNSTIPTTHKPEEESRIFIPFTIGGVFAAIFAVCQLFLFIFYRYHMPPIEEDIKEVEQDTVSRTSESAPVSEETPSGGINWNKVKLIAVAALMFSANQAMEICTMQFVPTFGQKSDLKLSESDAAFVLTGLTGAFAAGRFLGIFIILKFAPALMLCVSLVLVLIGNTIILIWANNNLTMLWTGCIILGAGFSTMYPSMGAFMERRLVFTNAIGSFMIVSVSVVAAIYPVIVGGLIEERVVVMTYTNFFSIICCCVGFALAYKFTYKSKERVR